MNNIDNINTFEDLALKFEALSRALSARVLGTSGDRKLRDQVVQLQSRVTKNFVKKESNSPIMFVQALDAKDYPKTLEIGSTIVLEYNRPDGYESMIQSLLRLCDGALRYVFSPDEIQAARATRAVNEKQFDTLEAEDLILPQNHPSFICPIMYADETDPVIMIAKPDRPLLVGYDKKITDTLIDCPLNALRSTEFVENLIQYIDHPVSLKTVREAEEAGYPLKHSPVTRKDLIGFIPLGPHETHVAAADWTIANLLSDGKKLGNPNFWFAVLWILVEQGKIQYLADMLPFLREQMIWRLKNRTSSASLTGLSGFVQTKLRLDASIYFCLVSSTFSLPPDPKFDTLRNHLMHTKEFLEIMKLVDIQIPSKVVKHILRTQSLVQLLNFAKKKGHQELLSLGSALVQKAFKVNQSLVTKQLFDFTMAKSIFVPLDGAASSEQIADVISFLPSSCQTLLVNEIYALIQLADPQKSAVDIQISLDWEAPPLPKAVVNWNHYQGKLSKLIHVQICPKTFRPFCVLQGNVSWRTIFEEIIDPNSGEILSTHRLYMEFCVKFNKIPSIDELMLFGYGKVSGHGISTLIEYSQEYLQSIIDDYQPLIEGRVEKAVELFIKSVSIAERERMEKED